MGRKFFAQVYLSLIEFLIEFILYYLSCYTTEMFPSPIPMSHVSSAAFAQARLRAGLASAQVCSGVLRPAYLPLYTLTRNH
jgi:hypothetical protein